MSNEINKKLLAHIGALVSIVIVCLALSVMYKTLHEIRINDVLKHIRELSGFSIFTGFFITAASYFVVTGYDVVALNHVKRRVPYPRAALSAFLASTFGNNIGFAIVTGTSIRYRVYSQVGLSTMEIAGVSTLCALTTTLGMSFIFAIAMTLQGSDATPSGIPISPQLLRLAGGIVLAAIVGYVSYAAFKPITLRTQNWSLRLPSAPTALAQIALATTNLMLVGSLIYVLLPAGIETSYITFLGVFSLALIAGSASNVPGGIGVFESVILLGLPQIPPAALLGSILVFRCIYYLTPLAIAAILLAYHETTVQQERIEHIHDSTIDLLDEIGPQLMAMIILFAGVLLLFSGSIPSGFDRAESKTYVPLSVIEFSHLAGAAAGIGLLIAARGLFRRLASSFNLVVMLLALGVVTSLLKGFGYREAIVLGGILILLWYTRPEFHRKATLFDEGFPVEWVSLLSAILAVTIWLGLFSFKDIPYSTSVWWNFAYESDYARFLRSTFVVLAVAGGVTLRNLLRRDPLPVAPEKDVLDNVRRILKNESNPRANLVLLGDKRLLFSDSGDAFIMYQIKGKSWVALSDPVGPREEYAELLVKFRGLCDRYGAWPVYYLVDGEHLALYEQLDLAIDKIGDDAMMPLEAFSLKGPLRAELDEVYQRLRRQGVKLEIVDQEKVENLLPELRGVSDDWLSTTQTRETGFARGFFDPYYIVNFPCAVVRLKRRIIAFAVIWASPDKSEMALDLMRHHHDAPTNVMDFLILELMLRARKQGYRWFNMGTAPLSGLEKHPLAPLWRRVGGLMYQQRENFGAIDNLQSHESVFNPVWRPKYLVSPDTVKLPRVLRDISRLTSERKALQRPDDKGLHN